MAEGEKVEKRGRNSTLAWAEHQTNCLSDTFDYRVWAESYRPYTPYEAVDLVGQQIQSVAYRTIYKISGLTKLKSGWAVVYPSGQYDYLNMLHETHVFAHTNVPCGVLIEEPSASS